MTVSVDARRLEMELAVINTGDSTIDFQAALHTYLRCGDVGRAQLEGLQGVNYQDAVLDQPRQQWVDVVTIAQELDRIYWEAPRELLLREAGRKLRIIASQFEDTVVWNPGPEKCASLPDMPDEDWPHMLCVEAAQIGNPVRLSPGEEWTGMQTLVVED